MKERKKGAERNAKNKNGSDNRDPSMTHLCTNVQSTRNPTVRYRSFENFNAVHILGIWATFRIDIAGQSCLVFWITDEENTFDWLLWEKIDQCRVSLDGAGRVREDLPELLGPPLSCLRASTVAAAPLSRRKSMQRSRSVDVNRTNFLASSTHWE